MSDLAKAAVTLRDQISRTMLDDDVASAVRVVLAALPEPECACLACEGSGWVQVYSPKPPAFETCQECFNPCDLPGP